MDIIVSSGVVSTGRIINDGHMDIWEGGKAVSTTISKGGEMVVARGGSAVSTTISKGGEMEVDGRADRIKVLAGGTLIVNRAATVTNVTWTPGVGTIEFEESVKIYDIFTSSYSGVYYASGGKLQSNAKTMSGKTVGKNAAAIVMTGGKAASFTVSNGGSLDIWSGGNINNVKLTGGGELIVRSGCTATNIAWTPTVGNFYLESGAKTTFTSSYSGVYVGTGEKLLSHTATMTGKTVNDQMHVFKGGTAKKTKLTGDGRMIVWSGGVAQSTTVNGDCTKIEVYSGGTANSTVVTSRGSMYISGGIANDTVVEKKGKLAIFGGTVNRVTANSGGRVKVYGGTLNSATINSGYIDLSSGVVSRTTLNNNGQLNVMEGQAIATTVNNGGWMSIAGGQATSTTVKSDAGMYISGGMAVSNTVSGNMLIFGGTATVTTVNNGGSMYVYGGQATSTTVNYGGCLEVGDYWWEGDFNPTATSTTINNGGSMYVNGGQTITTTVNSGGSMSVNNGQATSTTVNNEGRLQVGGYWWGEDNKATAIMTTVNAGGSMCVSSGGTATSTTINNGGSMSVGYDGSANAVTVNKGGSVYIGGSATNIKENGGYVDADYGEATYVRNTFGNMEINGSATVHSMTSAFNVTVNGSMYVYGGTVKSATVNNGGSMCVSSGTVSNNTVKSGGILEIYNGQHRGSLQIEDGGTVNIYGGSIDFTAAEQDTDGTWLVNNLSAVHMEGWGASYTATVPWVTAGTYKLAQNAGEISVALKDLSGSTLGTVSTTGPALDTGFYSYGLTLEDGNLTLTVMSTEVSCNQYGLGLGDMSGGWCLEYSTDDFEHVCSVSYFSEVFNTYGFGAGSYSWRLRSQDSEEWEHSGEFEVAEPVGVQHFKAYANDNPDLFFAHGNGVWSSQYKAQHQGTLGGWGGTGEKVELTGKNRIADIFEGSTDANVLVLTDDANGDALFLDDIFTALPDDLSGQHERLAQIKEIRAGAGNDIVDLTSKRFGYSGGVKVSGGDGNDTIWANSGDNKLFGDAGNDRLVGASGNDVLVGGIGNDSMHGGGGDDIFAFCDGWGNDTVEQLSGGKVTLWFESGDEANWNPDTLTYDEDGVNTVKVSGVTADKVTLKFGNEDGQYAVLSELGAFSESIGKRIFEEDKGILA